MESPHWKLEIRNCFAHISVNEREPMLWRLRLPILYGIATGTLLVLSLPKPDIYPLAWLAIIASGVLPLIWFKRRGWFE